MLPTRIQFYLDLLERSVWTFAQAFIGSWIVLEGADFDSIFTEDVLKVALVAGAIAVGKAILSTKLPWANSETASTLPG